MEANLILKAIEFLEMAPHGVFTGAVGAMLSLFVVNGNTFSWRKTGLILFSGVFICGYSLPLLESKLLGGDDNRALALFINIIIGFIASDALSSIKSAAPTITNFFVNKGFDFIKKFIPTNTSNND